VRWQLNGGPSRFVHQQFLWFGRNRPRDAQSLLLDRQIASVPGVQSVFTRPSQIVLRRKRPFDDIVQIGLTAKP
jgi:hypothetical protein